MKTRATRILFCLAAPLLVHSQSPVAPPDQVAEAIPAAPITPGLPILPVTPLASASGISDERILHVIPNFQAVSDPTTPYTPLRVQDKWRLFVKESLDPYTFSASAAGAALSQWHNAAPKYGEGTTPYFQRFGAAQADVTTQNFFSDAVLASLLHEDPRYFRKGPAFTVVRRIGYALSRVVITRKDSGRNGFSYSGVFGTGLGIALSNAYYPPASVNGGEMGSRALTSFSATALGNLLPEFWPDVKAKLDQIRHR